MTTKKSKIKTKPTKEFLKYEFTEDEIHQKGLDLARLNKEHAAIESEKKSVVSGFKAKIDATMTDIETLSNHINNGHEHRYIDCEVRFHDPNTGMKSIFRKDNGELVKKESMSDEEMQTELELE